MEKYIYKALIDFDFKSKAVICSVIDWKGSVPRSDYPLMLVHENGKVTGTVGGGEMEHLVIESAKHALETGITEVKRFELSGTKPEEAASVCGGATTVLVEIYTAATAGVFESLHLLSGSGKQNVLLTEVIESDSIKVKRKVINDKSDLDGLSAEFLKNYNTVLSRHKSKAVIENDRQSLIQLILPPARLHIFGSGHVAQAVARLAHFSEIEYIIYDDRADLACNENFPDAVQLITQPVDQLSGVASFTSNDFILVATRGHRHDYQLMKWLLNQPFSYLGLMCSMHKRKVLFQGLQDNGFTEEQLQTVHAPVGLDIGSETVPEIAVSIISEIIHHYRNGGAGSLSLSKGMN